MLLFYVKISHMSPKRSLVTILILVVIFLLCVVGYLIQKDNLEKDRGLGKEKIIKTVPKFEDFAVEEPKSQGNQSGVLDFTNSPYAAQYASVFTDSRLSGKNALAQTYRVVSLPCLGDTTIVTSDCYTLWIYDTNIGQIMKVGDNHYLPTEVHLDSRLIKSGDEYFVVEGDDVRLIYRE